MSTDNACCQVAYEDELLLLYKQYSKSLDCANTLRVFGVLPMVPLVGNICTIGTNGITIFTIAPISLPMVPLVIKLVHIVQMLPGNTGEPRKHAFIVKFNISNEQEPVQTEPNSRPKTQL